LQEEPAFLFSNQNGRGWKRNLNVWLKYTVAIGGLQNQISPSQSLGNN
jgi:hypothetical protein